MRVLGRYAALLATVRRDYAAAEALMLQALGACMPLCGNLMASVSTFSF